MSIIIEQADVLDWLRDYSGERFQGVLSDPPYALISINKRFGKKGAAPAKFGTDGRFNRLSSGFLNQQWDSFQSLGHYQAWVTEWSELLIANALHPGAICLFFGGTRTWHRLACGLEDGGFDVYDTLMWVYGQGFPKSHKVVEGYGTALKPAWEPIIMCRAPRGKHTFAQLATQFGSGALNINGARVPAADSYTINTFDDGAKPFGDGAGHEYTGRRETKGRWPANVIHDGIDRPWAKFFYCAKANKKEKGEYNNHPTVKPLKLLEYLATLILPPDNVDSRILVPFSGSGSEIIGAARAGWNHVVGIEKKIEYNIIADKRIEEMLNAEG